MKKKAKPPSSRIYSEVRLSGIKHSNTIHRLATIKRLLQQYLWIEWASYNPRGRNRLEEPDDHDAFFLTRTGKPYSRSACCHHWNRLFALAQSQFKKEGPLEFSPHDLRHLLIKCTIIRIHTDSHGDATVESARLERFRYIMKCHNPETMKTSIKTMNKRQAMKAALYDEGVQDQDIANAQVAYSKWIEISSPGNSPTETSSSRDVDEFD